MIFYIKKKPLNWLRKIAVSCSDYPDTERAAALIRNQLEGPTVGQKRAAPLITNISKAHGWRFRKSLPRFPPKAEVIIIIFIIYVNEQIRYPKNQSIYRNINTRKLMIEDSHPILQSTTLLTAYLILRENSKKRR